MLLIHAWSFDLRTQDWILESEKQELELEFEFQN